MRVCVCVCVCACVYVYVLQTWSITTATSIAQSSFVPLNRGSMTDNDSDATGQDRMCMCVCVCWLMKHARQKHTTCAYTARDSLRPRVWPCIGHCPSIPQDQASRQESEYHQKFSVFVLYRSLSQCRRRRRCVCVCKYWQLCTS